MDTNKPLRRDGVRLREMDGESMLYDEEKNKIHILNAVAGSIWEMCDGAHDTLDMEKKLRQSFEISGDVNLEEDIRHIIQNFADLELFVSPAL